MLPVVGFGIRMVAAGVWLTAGLAKLADLGHFKEQVGKYDLLPHIVVAPFAYGLPFLETGIGLYLLVGLLIRGTALVSTALMVVFLIAQGQAWARGLQLDCGCFGSLAPQKASHVGLWTMLRDVALGLPGLVLVFAPARLWSLDARLFRRPDRFARSEPTA